MLKSNLDKMFERVRMDKDNQIEELERMIDELKERILIYEEILELAVEFNCLGCGETNLIPNLREFLEENYDGVPCDGSD